MKKKKVFLVGIFIMVLFVGFLFISEYRFSYKSALQARIKAKNIEFIELIHVNKDLDLAVYKNYYISLNEVKSKPEIYQIKQLQNGVACFVGEMFGRYIKR
jgi:hypothetical protein